MTTREPRARVEAFIADWHEQWKSASDRMKGNVDFDDWGKVVRGIDERHFVAGAGCGSASSFGSPPTHDPGVEAITSTSVDGDAARVETSTRTDIVPRFHEYRLTRAGDDWRIASVMRSLNAPGKIFMDAGKRDELLATARPDAPLAPLGDDVDPRSLDRLFDDGQTVLLGGEELTASMRRLGELVISSGVLGVFDLGYLSPVDIVPLARTIAPGRYPVDVVVVDNRVAAVRVVLAADAPTASWHPADVTPGGHVVGVDAGNLGIVDLAVLTAQVARDLDQTYEKNVLYASEDPIAHLFSLAAHDSASASTSEGDAVVVASGYGDGGYPVYWGADASGKLTALVVDFQVLAASEE